MTITALGFDYGQKKIGVAAGQTTTATAEALETITASGEEVFARIGAIIKEWRPATLIVGLPLGADGKDDNPVCKAAKRFGGELEKRFSLPVDYVDERLTSAEADNALREALAPGKKLTEKKRKARDAIAAKLILESWLAAQI